MAEENENTFAFDMAFGGNAEKFLTLIADKLEAIEKSLGDVKKNTDHVSDGLEKIKDKPLDDAAKAAAELARQEKEATEKTKQLTDAQEHLKDSFEKVKTAGKPIVHGLMAIAGAGIAGAIGTFKMINATTELGDSQIKMARNLGISLSAFSEIAYVTDMAGVPIEKLRVTLATLARNATMDKDAFKQLGVSLVDSNGQLKSVDKLFMDVGDKLREMPNKTKASGLAMRAMGEQGAAMISAFGSSKEAWDEVAQRGRDLGIVMTDEFGLMSEAYQDSLADMKKSWGAFARGLTISMAPQLTVFFNKVADKVSAISKTDAGAKINESFSKLTDKVIDLFDSMVDLLPKLLDFVTIVLDMSGPLISLTDWVTESDTALKLLGLTIGSVFAAKSIINVMKFVSAIGMMASAYKDVKIAAEAATIAQGLTGAAGKGAIGNVIGSIGGKAGIYGSLIAIAAVSWTSAITDFVDFMKQKASTDKENELTGAQMQAQSDLADARIRLSNAKKNNPSMVPYFENEVRRYQDIRKNADIAYSKAHPKAHPPLSGAGDPLSGASEAGESTAKTENNYTSITQNNSISSDMSKIGQLIGENLNKLILSQFRYSELGSRTVRMGGV